MTNRGSYTEVQQASYDTEATQRVGGRLHEVRLVGKQVRQLHNLVAVALCEPCAVNEA